MAITQACTASAPIFLQAGGRSLWFLPIAGRALKASGVCSVAPGFDFSRFELAAPNWRPAGEKAQSTVGHGLLSLLRRKPFDPLLQLIELALHFLEVVFGILLQSLAHRLFRGLSG